jgi:hypothetical protein
LGRDGGGGGGGGGGSGGHGSMFAAHGCRALTMRFRRPAHGGRSALRPPTALPPHRLSTSAATRNLTTHQGGHHTCTKNAAARPRPHCWRPQRASSCLVGSNAQCNTEQPESAQRVLAEHRGPVQSRRQQCRRRNTRAVETGFRDPHEPAKACKGGTAGDGLLHDARWCMTGQRVNA